MHKEDENKGKFDKNRFMFLMIVSYRKLADYLRLQSSNTA
jgi:hypothetical protein